MFLIVLFFLPIVVDGFGLGKNWLLIGSGLLGLVIWVGVIILGKEEEMRVNKVWGLWMLLGVWATVAFLRLARGVEMRSIMTMGGWGTLMGLTAWFWLWLQTADREEGKKQLDWLTAAGIIVVVSSIIVFLIPASRLPISWPRDNPLVSIGSNFSPTGSLVAEAVLLIFLGLEWSKRLAEKFKSGNYWLSGAVMAVVVLGLGVDVFKIAKLGWAMMDNLTAWVMAVEVFKRSPIWGVGLGNFVEAFNLYRPASYNLTQFWSSVFGGSRYGGLQIWTELGLPGLVVIGLLVSKLFGEKKKGFDFWRLGIFWVILLLMPTTWVSWWLVVWLLANSVFETKEIKMVLRVGEKGFNAAPWVVGGIMVAVSFWGGYWWLRILRGEIYLRNSMLAAAKNDGARTYNEQIMAIGANPWAGEYRRVYAQTNLALAKTLLVSKEMSDDDRQKAAVLVQQAVREGKAAVALDNLNSGYWSNLAVIYRDLIGIVDGSADWSFQAYSQAVALDPANPILRLDLGGLLFAANRVEEADRVFELVVSNKPDFANGWYNWAYSAKRLNKLNEAVQRLSQAVALVPVDSGDYEKASGELAEWKKELADLIKKQGASAQASAPKPETLKTPPPLPTAGKEEKVNVPKEELEPPIVTPTPETN